MERVKFAAVLAYSIPLWIARLALQLVLAFVGLFLVPIAIIFGHWEEPRWKSPWTPQDDEIWNAPRWLWLWGNDQDGYKPSWFDAHRPQWPAWYRWWHWGAIRNSVNNLRAVPYITAPAFRMPTAYVWGRAILLRQGVYTRLVWALDRGDLLLGWKLSLFDEGMPTGFGVRYRKYG